MEMYSGFTLDLHPLSEKYLEQIRLWRQSDHVSQFMFQSGDITTEQQLEWYNRIKDNPTQKIFVMQKKGGTPIGVTQFIGIEPQNALSEWGFYIGDEQARLDGSGAEAEYLTIKYAFEEMDLHRLWCRTLSFNEKVLSMHNRFNMVQEGILREAFHKDNVYHDIHIHSILSHDFPQIKAKWEPYFTAWAKRMQSH